MMRTAEWEVLRGDALDAICDYVTGKTQ